jgi:thioredoxin 1
MASANVIELTNDNWDQEVMQSDRPVLVDFWAPWCGPCRLLAPKVDKIADQFAGKVKVGKLNIDAAGETASRFGISAIPQLFFFQGGELKERLSGVPSDAEIVKVLNRLLEV